jgi:hypothetical protein
MRYFSGDKEGRKAAAEYNKRLQELYESKFRDPDNPDECIGLNKNEVEQKRAMIIEQNEIMKRQIREMYE